MKSHAGQDEAKASDKSGRMTTAIQAIGGMRCVARFSWGELLACPWKGFLLTGKLAARPTRC